MVSEKVNTKVGMLLTPAELSRSYIVIQSIQVVKSAKGTDFKTEDLNWGQLRKLYPTMVKEAKDVFNNFCHETINKSKFELKQLLNKQKVECRIAFMKKMQ
jgi:hypothetical protein